MPKWQRFVASRWDTEACDRTAQLTVGLAGSASLGKAAEQGADEMERLGSLGQRALPSWRAGARRGCLFVIEQAPQYAAIPNEGDRAQDGFASLDDDDGVRAMAEDSVGPCATGNP
jgi:hypothetical protein